MCRNGAFVCEIIKQLVKVGVGERISLTEELVPCVCDHARVAVWNIGNKAALGCKLDKVVALGSV